MNSGKVGRRAAILRATVVVAVFRWHEAASEWAQCAARTQKRRLRNVTDGSNVRVLHFGDMFFCPDSRQARHASNDRTIGRWKNQP